MENLIQSLQTDDRICFFGDSITASGGWIRNIFEVFCQEYNHKKIKLFNCGVAGDSATRSLSRIYVDALQWFPRYVVVAFGMNDVGRTLYSPNYISENKEEEMQERIDTYRKSITEIVEKCHSIGAKVILCTPTPYDEISDVPAENLMCDVGLQKCATQLREIASQYHCELIDFGAALKGYLKEGNINVIGEDRVHPTDMGHHVMAQVFMYQLGMIETIDVHKQITLLEKNLLRFNTEQILRGIAFIEWNFLYETTKQNSLTLAQKKEKITSCLEDPNTVGYVNNMKKRYLEHIDSLLHLQEQLLIQTLEMY